MPTLLGPIASTAEPSIVGTLHRANVIGQSYSKDVFGQSYSKDVFGQSYSKDVFGQATQLVAAVVFSVSVVCNSIGFCNFTKGERSEHEFPISILLYRNRLLCFSRLRFLSRLQSRVGGCKSPARAYRAIASCSSVGPLF